MKTSKVIFIALTSLSSLTQAQEAPPLKALPDQVVEKKAPIEKSALIDPDQHIFGHPYGTSEDEFIKEEGTPDGYLRISAKKSLMIYGNSIGFIFLEGKLAGVRVNSSLLDWNIAKELVSKSRFHGIAWTVKGGLRNDISEKQVQKLFGDRLKGAEYRQFITYSKARLDIDFATMTSGGKTTRQVHAIYLMKDEEKEGVGKTDPRDRVRGQKIR